MSSPPQEHQPPEQAESSAPSLSYPLSLRRKNRLVLGLVFGWIALIWVVAMIKMGL